MRARGIILASVALSLVSGEGPVVHAVPCDRYEIQGLSVGSPLAAVRAKLGREGVTTRIARPGETEAASVEYVVADSIVYIEYDRRLDRKPEAHVDLLRASIASSAEALAALEERWGPPTAGRDELSRGLAGGPAVWVDERCGLAVSVYRRQGSWWAGDVGSFIQLESLASVRRGASPASAALAAGVAAAVVGADAAPADAETPLPSAAPSVMAPPPDRAPERIASAPPAYPPNLRLMGVKGRVSLAVLVGADGSVEDVRVTESVPAGRGFESAAVDAVKRWRYKPATQRGFAVAAEVPVVIEFK